MGLRALRPSAAIVKVMSVPDSRCIRVVTPDDHMNIGFHEILLHDMGEEELPFVATSELDYLCRVWPRPLFVFMSRYQQDLESLRKECKERFGCTQSGNCTHCGKYIQWDLGKHIAFYHMELAQLWRCPVMWCTVWKGTAQDCIDHMRRTHRVPLSVKVANLARFFPPWTVTREQWAAMTMPSISGVAIDTLLFSRVGSPLCHRYRIISRTGSHAAFRGTYMRQFHAFLEESDSAVMRRLHRQLTQELAARISLSMDSPASVPSRSAVGHRTVSRTRRPRRLKGSADSSMRPESDCRPPAEVSKVQALMDLALARFAGLGDGPRQVHPPWSTASNSPASQVSGRLDASGEEDSRCSVDQMSVSSACLNLDLLSSSSNDDSKDSAGLSDLSIALFCDSEEALTPVNSNQVLSDGDLPEESMPKDMRQVVRRCASPPGG